jgi:hypothetical protein
MKKISSGFDMVTLHSKGFALVLWVCMAIVTEPLFLLSRPSFASADPIVVDRVVASIQGVGVITSLQLIRYAAVNAVSETGYRKGMQEMQDDTFIRSSLNGLVDRTLMLKDAQLLSIKTPDMQEINVMVGQFRARFNSNNEYEAFMKKYAMDADYLNRFMSDELIIKQYINDEISMFVKISDEDVRTYYENNAEAFKGQTMEDADRHIKELLEQKEYDKQLKSWIKTLSLHRGIIILY